MAQLPVIPGNPADKTSLDTNFENTSANFTELYAEVALKLAALMSLASDLKIKGAAVIAPVLVLDQLYEIATVGTTDFTEVGASANTVGVQFTATGPTTGDGTALPIRSLIDDTINYTDPDDAIALWSVQKIGEMLGYKQGVIGEVETAGTYFIQESILGNQSIYSPGTWKLFYSDGTPGVKELSIGTVGTFLQSFGTGGPPVWAYPILGGTAPASATATGVAGETRYDSTYLYVCVATDTWKRTLLETW